MTMPCKVYAQPMFLDRVMLSVSAGFMAQDETLQSSALQRCGDSARPMKVALPGARAALPVNAELAGNSPCVATPFIRCSAVAAADSDQQTDLGTSGTCDAASDSALDPHRGTCTTLAILNIPYTYPKAKFQAEMEAEGLSYDYFHFPRDSRKGRNRGFAFVNFATVEAAQSFFLTFHGRSLAHPGDKEKTITVMPSALQGFESNARLHPFAAARPMALQGSVPRRSTRSCRGFDQSAENDHAGFNSPARRVLMKFSV